MQPPYPAPVNRLDLLQHASWARGLARALVSDAATAEDLTQDALALALARPVQADPKSWLAGTLRNLAAQRRRKEARRVRREREAAQAEGLQDHTSALAELEAKRRLMDHVMALGERNREVLLLRYVRGETPSAIAAREGRSVASVSNQLTRAHASLRQRLEADGGQGAWLGALVPMLRSKAGAWVGTGQATAAFGMGPWATMAWTIGKIVLVFALVGSIYALLAEPAAAPTMVGALDSDDPGGTDLALAGGTPLVGVKASRSRIAPSGAAMGAGSSSMYVPTVGLTAELLDSSGAPVSGATLELTAWRGSPLRATTDEQGHARWEAAPAGSELVVGMELDGRRWHEPIARLQLEPGEDASASWSVRVTSEIRGVAVDEGGARLPGQPIQLLAHKEISPAFGYFPSASHVYATVVTDGAGRFVFPRQVAGRYTLFPARRPGRWSMEFMGADELRAAKELSELFEGKTEVAHYEVCFEVPYNVDVVNVDATFYTGGAISGRTVSAASGLPIRGEATLSLADVVQQHSISVRTDDEGNFVTPPLPPGQYQLVGHRSPSGGCPAEPILVESGTDDVGVPFLDAAAVEVRTEFAPGVGPAAGVITLEPPLDGGRVYRSGYHKLELGQHECDETTLAPGSYGFIFMADDGSCAGSVAPIELGAGRLPGGIVIPVVPAATVEVVNRSVDTIAHVKGYIDKMRFHTTAVEPGGTVSVPAPPGNVTLILTGEGRDGQKTVAVKAVSGKTSTVDWE